MILEELIYHTQSNRKGYNSRPLLFLRKYSSHRVVAILVPHVGSVVELRRFLKIMNRELRFFLPVPEIAKQFFFRFQFQFQCQWGSCLMMMMSTFRQRQTANLYRKFPLTQHDKFCSREVEALPHSR